MRTTRRGGRKSRTGERINPAESRESSEVAVGGVEYAAVLDRECGNLRVGCDRPLNPSRDEQIFEQSPVPVARDQEPNDSPREPLIDKFYGLGHGKMASSEREIGGDANEGTN